MFAFLFGLVVAAYWTVMNNTFIADDFAFISRAGSLEVTGLWQLFTVLPSFVRPVPLFVWWIQYNVFGMSAWPAHLINTLLQAATAYLLFWFLTIWGARRLSAGLAATLFVISPVAPETVTWVSGRFDLLALMFTLLALCLYGVTIRSGNRFAFAGAMLAAVAAFFSKETAMVLIVLVPAMELLYGRRFPSEDRTREADSVRADLTSLLPRMYGPLARLSIFFVIFMGHIAVRYASLGRLGGYQDVPVIGRPYPGAAARTITTLLSPLNSHEFPMGAIYALLAFTSLLCLSALLVVFWRWQRTSAGIRRLWLFMAVFLGASIAPVYAQLFMMGVNHSLREIRVLYFPTLAVLSLVALGLLEFGWKNRKWQIGAAAALLALLPVYFVGVNFNNRPWERAAAINHSLPLQARALLPDPHENAKIYFRGVPEWQGGAYVFITGLQPAIRIAYDRDDLKVIYLGSSVKSARDEGDGYLFSYDSETGLLRLIRALDQGTGQWTYQDG